MEQRKEEIKVGSKVKVYSSGLDCELELDPIHAKVMFAMCKVEVGAQHLPTLEEHLQRIANTWHRYEYEAQRLIRALEAEGLIISNHTP